MNNDNLLQQDLNKVRIDATNNKIEVMQAFAEGKTIEYISRTIGTDSNWRITTNPIWDWHNYNYRIQVKQLKVRWDHLDPNLRYAAQDKNGQVWAYTYEPIRRHTEWSGTFDDNPVGDLTKIEGLVLSLDDNWADSMIVRGGFYYHGD